MFEAVSFFRGFDDRYGYETWESDLGDFFNYFSLTTEKNAIVSDLSWMEKLIIGGETTINYVDIGLSCRAFFVLGMLHTFIHLSQIVENPMLSKSPNLSANQPPILSLQRLTQIQSLQSKSN